MTRLLQWAGAIGVLTAAASPASPQSVADSASLNTFYRTWSRTTAEKGPEGYASFFALDATFLPPGEAPAHGRDAIRDWLRRTQAASTYTTQVQGLTVNEIRVIGDLALYLGTLKGLRVPKAGGEGTPFETKYFDVLRRTADGGWEFVYRMWSSNLP